MIKCWSQKGRKRTAIKPKEINNKDKGWNQENKNWTDNRENQ